MRWSTYQDTSTDFHWSRLISQDMYLPRLYRWDTWPFKLSDGRHRSLELISRDFSHFLEGHPPNSTHFILPKWWIRSLYSTPAAPRYDRENITLMAEIDMCGIVSSPNEVKGQQQWVICSKCKKSGCRMQYVACECGDECDYNHLS